MEPREQIRELSGFVTDRRMKLFRQVLSMRTRYLTVVLEDIYQPHNASAVLRSCECFGIQDVHIIENRNEYRINPDVVMGATKWLSLHKYRTEEDSSGTEEDNSVTAIRSLRKGLQDHCNHRQGGSRISGRL